jgi:FAD:protein FMN transferase
MRRAERHPAVFLILVSLFALTPLPSGAASIPEYADARPLMGTLVGITAEGAPADSLRKAVDGAYREMSRLSDMMNHYNPDSVVSEINREAGGRPVKVPRELMEVLVMARRVSERTHGAFDITVGSLTGWRFNPENPAIPSPEEIARSLPLVNYRDVILDEKNMTARLKRAGMRIDLGGIAKLYILRAGMQALKRRGIAHAMVNGGGDVLAMGTHHGRPWHIGIRHPRRDDALLATVALTRGWVVTSGDYERYFFVEGKRYQHILDPRTGYPAAGPQQVTLVSRDMAKVDGYSLAIMVRGAAWGRELIARTPGLAGIIVDHAGRVWASPGMERYQLPATTAPESKK